VDISVDANVSDKHTVSIFRDEYEDSVFLYESTSQISILSPSSSLKMETVCFSETLVPTDESTRHKNPEEHHYDPHAVKTSKLIQ
jgi:hypothetical protein